MKEKIKTMLLNSRPVVIILLAILGLVVAFGIGNQTGLLRNLFSMNSYQSETAKLEDEYQKLLTQLETEKAIIEKRHEAMLCVQEKAIASSNFKDLANGLMVSKDLNNLAQKKNRECGEVIQVTFQTPTS